VREQTRAALASDLGLGDALLLGRGEAESGGGRKPSLLSDAFEAVVAAIFLDAGYAVFGQVTEGMDLVRKIRRGDKMKEVRRAAKPEGGKAEGEKKAE